MGVSEKMGVSEQKKVSIQLGVSEQMGVSEQTGVSKCLDFESYWWMVHLENRLRSVTFLRLCEREGPGT